MVAVDLATAPEKAGAVEKAIARRHEAAYLRAVTQISIGDGPDMIMRDLAISQLVARVEAIALGGQASAFACKPESAARAARFTDALELYAEASRCAISSTNPPISAAPSGRCWIARSKTSRMWPATGPLAPLLEKTR